MVNKLKEFTLGSLVFPLVCLYNYHIPIQNRVNNMNFKENSRYLLEQSIFNRSILTCHCVQDGWVYLSDTPSSQVYTEKVEYKYNIKKERMYVFNKVFQTWDNVQEYTVTEYGGNVNTGYQSVNVV